MILKSRNVAALARLAALLYSGNAEITAFKLTSERGPETDPSEGPSRQLEEESDSNVLQSVPHGSKLTSNVLNELSVTPYNSNMTPNESQIGSMKNVCSNIGSSDTAIESVDTSSLLSQKRKAKQTSKVCNIVNYLPTKKELALLALGLLTLTSNFHKISLEGTLAANAKPVEELTANFGEMFLEETLPVNAKTGEESQTEMIGITDGALLPLDSEKLNDGNIESEEEEMQKDERQTQRGGRSYAWVRKYVVAGVLGLIAAACGAPPEDFSRLVPRDSAYQLWQYLRTSDNLDNRFWRGLMQFLVESEVRERVSGVPEKVLRRMVWVKQQMIWAVQQNYWGKLIDKLPQGVRQHDAVCMNVAVNVATLVVAAAAPFVVEWARDRRDLYQELGETRGRLRAMEALEQRRAQVQEQAVQPRPHGDSEQSQCIVCWSRPTEMLFRPCKHISMCEQCWQQLPEPKQCPKCRSRIRGVERVYP